MNKKILIAIGITFLFLGACITPSVAIDNVKKSTILICSGNTLYVGGSGEGNYTKIQDAVDNASDGDTVFVFDDSSPYHELITINTSINLIGENKETTIITAEGNYTLIVKINADDCLIKNFYFQNTSDCAISANSVSGFEFINNILYSCSDGISLTGCSDCVISENQFIYCSTMAVSLWEDVNYCIISHNTFYKCGYFGAIFSDYNSQFNNISYNMFENCELGLLLVDSHNWIISHNIFRNNTYGIVFSDCSENVISFNNFQFNLIANAMVMYRESENRWSRNYWNRPRILPKIIHGIRFTGEGYNPVPIPMFNLKNVDWRPALLPNKIEV